MSASGYLADIAAVNNRRDLVWKSRKLLRGRLLLRSSVTLFMRSEWYAGNWQWYSRMLRITLSVRGCPVCQEPILGALSIS